MIKRKELLVLGSERVSYSRKDVLVEDFFEDRNHPYALYDLKGNLLKTNIKVEKEGDLPLFELYKRSLRAVLGNIKRGNV